MDFMKVLDQTVRDIKREVNLKVLKVPEIEQKVLDATSSEPWGPHGSALLEIAQSTKKITDCQLIMNVLWTRVTDTGSNWRHVYKALTVIEYLVANGSERVVDDILEHSFRLTSISGFEYVEPNGKDVGINVRKKVETILSLLNDKDKIKAVRDKAASNRDKYFGLSSTGITYKSSSTSYGTNNSNNRDRYGGFGSTKEDDSFKDSYKDRERYGEETEWKHGVKDGSKKESLSSENEPTKFKKEGARSQIKTPSSTKRPSTKPDPISKSSNPQPNNYEEDFDDFDPRGSSTGASKPDLNQAGPVGESLLFDLMDAPTSIPTETITGSTNTAAPEVDLFSDATYVSAPPHIEATGVSHSKDHVDFFTPQSAFPAVFSSNVDLFGGPHSSSSEIKPSNSEPTKSDTFDPFAAIPLNNFEGSDLFGDFTSNTATVTTEPSQISSNNSVSDLKQTSQNSTNSSVISNLDQISKIAPQPAPKKGTFQVKSGIWADSLSRGIIDLNITAPKKVSLADIGIVGGLDDGSDEKEKGAPAAGHMGRAMGGGPPSALDWSGFTSSTSMGGGSFPSFGQQQFGSYK